MKDKGLYRIIDANLNRLREALRVCEDIVRFFLEDKRQTSRLKRIRHAVLEAAPRAWTGTYRPLISARAAGSDIGRQTIKSELKREGVTAIMLANLQRAKESARVLEEISKISDKRVSSRFKKIRFRIYDTEKAIIGGLRPDADTR